VQDVLLLGQVHPVPPSDTSVNPAGKLSLTVTVPAVAAEPAFVTVTE
jgi:hypothetical protein